MKVRKEIFYIYSYLNGVRGRNVGFARVKIRDGKCKLAISLKAPYEYLAEKIQICLYKREGSKLLGLNLGYMHPVNEISQFKTEIELIEIEKAGFSIEDMSGVYLYSNEHEQYVFTADWDTEDVQRTPQYLSNLQVQCMY